MQGSRSFWPFGPACLLLGFVTTGPEVALGQTLTRAQVEASLPALEALAQRTVDAGDVPGLAIAVVFDDEAIFLKGFGRRKSASRNASTPIPSSRSRPCRSR